MSETVRCACAMCVRHEEVLERERESEARIERMLAEHQAYLRAPVPRERAIVLYEGGSPWASR